MSIEFKCSLSTPQGSLLDGTATSVIAPGVQGQFGVWANHENMLAILQEGVVTITLDEKSQYFAIDSGSLEVDQNHDVTILVDTALVAENEKDAKKKMLKFQTPPTET